MLIYIFLYIPVYIYIYIYILAKVASTSIGAEGMRGASVGWGGLIADDAQAESLKRAIIEP